MNVASILLSQFAHVTDAGELTVYRTFRSMAGSSFPARVPLMALSVVIHAHADEAGTEHEMEIRLLDDDRNPIDPTPVTRSFRFQEETPPPGMPLRHTRVQRIQGVQFPRVGTYAFEVYIDGTYHGTASFFVGRAEEEG